MHKMNHTEKIDLNRRKVVLGSGATMVFGQGYFPPDNKLAKYTKQQLRDLGKPPMTTHFIFLCDGVQWYWDQDEAHADDNVKYLIPTGHVGNGRYVLYGEVTYKSFSIYDDLNIDSSDGIKEYWGYCIKHNLPFTLGSMSVLVTKNNIFGQFGSATVRHKVIQGKGRGQTKIVFRPTSNSRSFLYDGGGSSGHNYSILLNQTFKDLTILLDTSNCRSVGVYRLYGDAEKGASNQNFEFHSCSITGKGSLKETFFYQLLGTANTSENKSLFCEIDNLTHVCHLNNPQGVDQSFIECDVWLIKSHFFVVNKGALEIRITGGSWIWEDNPRHGVHKPQYLFYIPDSSGVGRGNMTSTVTAFKPEMRNQGAGLVYAPNRVGSIFINFISCNFLGGGIKKARSMVTLSQNKRVTFRDSAISETMGITFVNILSSSYNSYDHTGLVLFSACGFERDISKNIVHEHLSDDAYEGKIKLLPSGRSIADELCHGIIGESGGIQEKFAFSFDTNPYDSGRGMPPYSVKRLPIKTYHEAWPWKHAKELSIVLPHNCIIVGFKIYKPLVENGNTKKYKLNVGNGDKTIVYQSLDVQENKALILDLELPMNERIICSNENSRRVRVWEESGGFDTYSNDHGVCEVLYI